MINQINITKYIKPFVVLVFMIGVCLLYFQPTYAESAVDLKGLTLSPLRTELEISPGTSLDGVLTVKNSTDKPMTVSLTAEEFSVINQQYDYAFTAESNMAKWVRFTPIEVDLTVGETKDVKYSVGVPLSAEPGGRYISLFASTDTASSNSAVKSRQRVASLLYITVSGQVTRVGNLVSLSSPWLISGTSSWSAALRNYGTTHFRSRYNIQVLNLIGNDTAASSLGDDLILPGTVRSIYGDLALPKFPGIYKVIYTVGLGDSPAVVETRYILYMPWYAAIFFIVLVILLVSTIVRKVQRKRQKNQSV